MIRFAVLAFVLPGMAEAACRQALALGLDVSGSVDATEYRMQLDGLATALNSERVQEVLFIQPDAPVQILVYEWSGPFDQTVVVQWTPIATAHDLAQITAKLRSHRRATAAPTTAIGAAMLAGFAFLDDRPECWKRTLDLSGDGQTNTGPRPQDIGAHRTPNGVVVNGLVIGSGDRRGDDERFADIKELSSYYTSYVIRGSGSFVEVALGFEDYAAAMERKLMRELASLVMGEVAPDLRQ
ncbi:DUF1194 domain-containing protein [Yoonia sp. F2084L]|uniref:DUF1194 domain-containing protein n=1 Tax=Yoonia sp. F2084L TaxID=2926419 RepID=UPI001FF23286|nr:DUF1194 domain-containing protein [Yoonia sp. F2084L]